MSLTQDQIAHIAKLSKLNLSPEALEAYRHNLDGIVDYVDMLGKVPASELEKVEISHPHILPLRDDQVIASEASQKELLSVTGQKVIASQIALPNIMG